MDNVSSTVEEIQWSEFGQDNGTTNPSITGMIDNESHEVVTVVIFVISAVLVIILIFMVAIFIDSRQQKIQDLKVKAKRKRANQKIFRVFPTLPTIGETSRSHDDQKTIVDNMFSEHTDIP